MEHAACKAAHISAVAAKPRGLCNSARSCIPQDRYLTNLLALRIPFVAYIERILHEKRLQIHIKFQSQTLLCRPGYKSRKHSGSLATTIREGKTKFGDHSMLGIRKAQSEYISK
jgi:hypothetical protein